MLATSKEPVAGNTPIMMLAGRAVVSFQARSHAARKMDPECDNPKVLARGS